MRKMVLLLFVLAFMFALAPATWAQWSAPRVPGATQTTVGPSPSYTVREGDTLWELAGAKLDDPRQWRVVVEKNPFLQEPGRVFQRGDKIIALIRPGEKLVGLEQLGILPSPLPIAQLRQAPSQAAAPAASGPPFLLLLFVLLLGLLGLLILRWARDSQRRRAAAARLADPATAGPPFVRPDVPRTRNLVEREFDRVASAAAQQYPDSPTPVRLQRVGPIERGFVSGTGRVYYADGTNREMTLTRQLAFRALYELPGGERELLYSLAGCMNPVTYSGEYLRGFDWEPAAEAERVIVPAPEVRPERPTAPAPVVPAHAVVVAEGVPEFTTVTVNGVEFRVPRGFAVTYDGNGIVLAATGPGEVMVRLAARKAKRPKVVAKAAEAK